jgi:hypothetical protein
MDTVGVVVQWFSTKKKDIRNDEVKRSRGTPCDTSISNVVEQRKRSPHMWRPRSYLFLMYPRSILCPTIHQSAAWSYSRHDSLWQQRPFFRHAALIRIQYDTIALCFKRSRQTQFKIMKLNSYFMDVFLFCRLCR